MFIEGWDALADASTLVERLPEDLRLEVFMTESQKIIRARNDPNVDPRVQLFFNDLGHLWQAGSIFDSTRGRVVKLARKFASPHSDRVVELFRPYGIQDLFLTIEEMTAGRMRADTVRANLNDFVSRRHRIAHGNVGETPTMADTSRYVENIRQFCRHVDAVLGIQLMELSGSYTWSGRIRSSFVEPDLEFPNWF